MRQGWIVLHRKGITEEEWRNPERTLAWIDLLLLAAWQDFTNQDGIELKRGEFIASVRYLAQRWNKPKTTVERWLDYWIITDKRLEKVGHRCGQSCGHKPGQVPGHFFIVNYAKYQEVMGQSSGQQTGHPSGQVPGQIKRKQDKQNSKKENNETVAALDARLSELDSIGKMILSTLEFKGYIVNDHFPDWHTQLRQDFTGIDLREVCIAYKNFTKPYRQHLNAFRNFCRIEAKKAHSPTPHAARNASATGAHLPDRIRPGHISQQGTADLEV